MFDNDFAEPNDYIDMHPECRVMDDLVREAREEELEDIKRKGE